MSNIYLLCLATLLACGAQAAEDARQLATMPAAAQATLREEMLANLRVLNAILDMVASGKIKEAGALAEDELGVTAMGKNRSLPVESRPGTHMPAAMHALGVEGHKAASEFARVAATGDRDKTVAALPKLTGACVACHFSYRVR
jgi:hypothetical protein